MAIKDTNPEETLADQQGVYFETAHLKADLGGRTIRGGAVTLATQGLKFLIGIAGTVILARLLTPQDYGLIGMVAVIIGFVSIFKDLGLSSATIQRAEINAHQISTLFWINVALSVGVMLVCVAIAPLVAWFYHEPRLRLITAAYGFGFLLGGLTVQHEALLRRQMRFAALAATEILALCTSVGTAIVLARYGAGYWALVASQLSLGLVYLFGMWVLCTWRPGLPSRNTGIRSMLAFGGNLTGFSIVNYFSGNVDNLLIGRYRGTVQLGFYSRAYQLLVLPLDQVNTPITAVAVPVLSRLIDSPERYRQAYLRILDKLTMVTLPGVAFMIGTSDWLVRLLLGSQWAPVGRIFGVFGLAALLLPVANSTGWLFVTQNRTNEMMRWGFIDTSIKVTAIVIGLRWGPVGVATGIVIRTYVMAPLLFWFVGRKGPVKAGDFYRALAAPGCAAICVLIALSAFRRYAGEGNLIMHLVVALPIAIVTALLALLSTRRGRLTLSDLKNAAALLVARKAV